MRFLSGDNNILSTSFFLFFVVNVEHLVTFIASYHATRVWLNAFSLHPQSSVHKAVIASKILTVQRTLTQLLFFCSFYILQWFEWKANSIHGQYLHNNVLIFFFSTCVSKMISMQIYYCRQLCTWLNSGSSTSEFHNMPVLSGCNDYIKKQHFFKCQFRLDSQLRIVGDN